MRHVDFWGALVIHRYMVAPLLGMWLAILGFVLRRGIGHGT
jgi:hypothetical protein